MRLVAEHRLHAVVGADRRRDGVVELVRYGYFDVVFPHAVAYPFGAQRGLQFRSPGGVCDGHPRVEDPVLHADRHFTGPQRRVAPDAPAVGLDRYSDVPGRADGAALPPGVIRSGPSVAVDSQGPEVVARGPVEHGFRVPLLDGDFVEGEQLVEHAPAEGVAEVPALGLREADPKLPAAQFDREIRAVGFRTAGPKGRSPARILRYGPGRGRSCRRQEQHEQQCRRAKSHRGTTFSCRVSCRGAAFRPKRHSPVP